MALDEFASWPAERRDHRIVYLGWLTREKGVFDLLAAFACVIAADPRAELVMSGPHADPGLDSAIEHLGLHGRVEVRDWTAGQAKTRLLASSKVLALPSYSEGFPVVLLEALAAGLPVVASDVGGVADAVADGVTGFLIQPGDVASLASRIGDILHSDELARLSEGVRRPCTALRHVTRQA